MPRTLDGVSCEFPPEVKELAFSINERTAPRGCPGYWCEWCYFSSGFRRYFEVDHIIPVGRAKEFGYGPEMLTSVQNACVLCIGCNGSKSKYGFPRHGVGLAYRSPNQNLAWGDRRAEPLSWDEFILMAQRKGRFKRQK